MNEDILKGKWNEIKGNIRSKWGKLTDDDVDTVQGNAETLIGKIQQAYGHGRDRVEREVNEFLGSYNRSTDATDTQPGHRLTDTEGDNEKRRRVS
jgi:uncharacterized protein YjbJ (UPF0337 family)